MKHRIFFTMMLIAVPHAAAAIDSPSLPSSDEIEQAIRRCPKDHPRLMLAEERFEILLERTKEDERMAFLRDSITRHADKLLDQQPVERKLEGRRLLSVSREALDRLSVLPMAFRLSGKQAYLERAER